MISRGAKRLSKRMVSAGRPMAKLQSKVNYGNMRTSNRRLTNPRTVNFNRNFRAKGAVRSPNRSRGRKAGFGIAAGAAVTAGVGKELMSRNTPWTSSYQALTGSPNFMRTAGKASIQTAFSSRKPIIRRGNINYYGGKWVSGSKQGVNPVDLHNRRR